MTTHPRRQFPGHGYMDDLTTECSFNLQVTWVIAMLGLFFDMLSMGICTTRHWQMFGRLVQELNVCTVYQLIFDIKYHIMQVSLDRHSRKSLKQHDAYE